MTAPVDKASLEQIHAELHDLCQPLTAIQCHLEMGKLVGTEQALREAVQHGLEETQRMFNAVDRVRHELSRCKDGIQQASA